MLVENAHRPNQFDAHNLLGNAITGRFTCNYKRAQKIYSQGNIADSVFFVQEGCVELAYSDGKTESVLGVAEEGQFFGGTCLHHVAVRIASATALVDARITSVSKQAIAAAITERPRFEKMFHDHLWYNNTSQMDLVDRLLKVAKHVNFQTSVT
jgi:CRP-like cAMP-binding protein